MKLFRSLLLVSGAAAFLLVACDKNEVVSQLNLFSVEGNTNFKVVHASAYNTNYSVQLKINDVRVSNNMSYSTPFPGGGLNTGGSSYPWYMSMAGGDKKISLSVAKVGTSTDSIMLSSNTTYFGPDQYYTAFLTDTGANTQIVKKIENRTPPANGTSRLKFVNLIPNLPAADLYWGTNKVASNVAYQDFSTEFLLNEKDTGRWYIRPAGALPTAPYLAVYPAIGSVYQTMANQRIFTVFSRGWVGLTGNRVPAISLVFN